MSGARRSRAPVERRRRSPLVRPSVERDVLDVQGLARARSRKCARAGIGGNVLDESVHHEVVAGAHHVVPVVRLTTSRTSARASTRVEMSLIMPRTSGVNRSGAWNAIIKKSSRLNRVSMCFDKRWSGSLSTMKSSTSDGSPGGQKRAKNPKQEDDDSPGLDRKSGAKNGRDRVAVGAHEFSCQAPETVWDGPR